MINLQWYDAAPGRLTSNRYTYDYGPLITASGRFDCIYDGIKAMETMSADPSPEAAAWTGINGSLINHACGAAANTVAKWVRAEDMYYIVYATTRDVAPGAQLFSNYNDGRSRYWRRAASLAADGVPAAHIVRCACQAVCPNLYAFDRRIMDPHLYAAPDVEAERAAVASERRHAATVASGGRASRSSFSTRQLL